MQRQGLRLGALEDRLLDRGDQEGQLQMCAQKTAAAAAQSSIWRADGVTQTPITEFRPYANNSRSHSEASITKLKASVACFGFVTPILITVVARSSPVTAGTRRQSPRSRDRADGHDQLRGSNPIAVLNAPTPGGENTDTCAGSTLNCSLQQSHSRPLARPESPRF